MAKFSSRERELLAEICRNYPILTDTSYTLQTINQKKEAWVKIQAEFNSMNPGKPPRDGPQLKGLWKRLKLKAKFEIDAQKKDARQTGGGSPKPALGRPEQILSEMFSGQFDPLPDTMDDDAGPFQEGPEELEVSGCEAGTSQQSEACETPKRPSKRKNTDNLQEELLKFAREEHEEKMKTQQAKRRLIAIQEESEKLRLLLLQHECKIKNILP